MSGWRQALGALSCSPVTQESVVYLKPNNATIVKDSPRFISRRIGGELIPPL
jgi:hypothetical protein